MVSAPIFPWRLFRPYPFLCARDSNRGFSVNWKAIPCRPVDSQYICLLRPRSDGSLRDVAVKRIITHMLTYKPSALLQSSLNWRERTRGFTLVEMLTVV